jgi:hypothetical protein
MQMVSRRLPMTANPVNDIFGQAREGSVAAIIQILNERLAADGIRTRAMFADGVLQLLCEAPTPEQLEQSYVVNRIRKVLETISPRRIRKVNINSRIVREQQLLWLEEINRDPERQLLWSELITLKQPGLIKQWMADLTRLRRPRSVMPKGISGTDLRQRKSFVKGIAGGAGACVLLLLLGGWLLRDRFFTTVSVTEQNNPTGTAAPAPAPPVEQVPLPEDYDVFARAVRIAEETAQAGQAATTAEEWLQLAARWRQASDLMAEVPPEDNRYQLAQDRVNAYRANSEALLQKASGSN